MHKRKTRCLLVHVPHTLSGGGLEAMSISMGLFALADTLTCHGFPARIIHLGLEQINNQDSTIQEYIRKHDIILIGFSLHWFLQSYDTIRIVNKIKSAYPGVKIVFGGYTASFFAQEILKKYAQVDFVVRGDGELPLLKLTRALVKKQKTFYSVPNLAWRDGQNIIINPITYCADNAVLEGLNFTNFSLLENFRTYKKTGLSEVFYLLKKGFSPGLERIFPVCIGRGCLKDCSFCGGAKSAQKIINNRRSLSFRSPQAVWASIKNALLAGYQGVYLDFDPWAKRNYFKELFSLVRSSGIKMIMQFVCWSLPDQEFIDDLERTFKGNASLLISPATGSDRLRKLNKGPSFSNRELVSALTLLEKKGIRAQLYFSYPIPFTSRQDLKQENGLLEELTRRFSGFHKIIRTALCFDPASPMFIDPDGYKIEKKLNCFTDYCRPAAGAGYSLKGLNRQSHKRLFNEQEKASLAVSSFIPRAKEYYRFKNYKQAIVFAGRALRLDHKNIEAFLLLGAGYEAVFDNRRALAVYRRAIKVFPRDIRLLTSLARIYQKLKMYKKAAVLINKLHKFNKVIAAG